MVKPKRLGHVYLWVKDVARSKDFYSKVLGLAVNRYTPGKSAFLSAADDSSHELAIGQVGMEAPGPYRRHVGLYHYAWEMGSFDDLKAMYHRMKEMSVKIVGIGDHGTSMGVYFYDPDGNEVEVFYELPQNQWRDKDGKELKHFPGTLEEEVARVR